MKKCLVALSCLLCFSWVFGQEITVKISQLDLEEWPQVTIYLSILDSSQNPITDVDSFQITENSLPMTLENPDLQNAQGVTTFLLMDVSGSMQGAKLQQAQQAARSFVKLKRPQDKIALYTFSSNWERLVAPTKNEKLLKTYIGQMRAEGQTEYFFAIAKTFTEMQKHTGRRSLITLTDGRDTTNWQNAERKWQIVERVAKAKIPIYTIGLGNDVERGDLQKIANLTNGNFQFSPQESDLVSAFKLKAEQISGEYVFKYKTKDLSQSGTPRKVEVRFDYKGKTYTATSSYLSGGLIPKAAKAKTKQEAAQKSANNLSIFLTIGALLIFLGSLPPLLKMISNRPSSSAQSQGKLNIPEKKAIQPLTKDDIQGISRIKINEPSASEENARVKILAKEEPKKKPRIKLD